VYVCGWACGRQCACGILSPCPTPSCLEGPGARLRVGQGLGGEGPSTLAVAITSPGPRPSLIDVGEQDCKDFAAYANNMKRVWNQ